MKQRLMKQIVNLAKMGGALSVLALALSACSTLPSGGLGGSSHPNYAAGSALGSQLEGRARNQLGDQFLAAMDAQSGTTHSWRAKGARGVVIPRAHTVSNLKADPYQTLSAPRTLNVDHVVETEQGPYVLTRNSNVRTGPSTNYRALETIDSGTGVEVVGLVIGQPWMLIAVDNQVRGYVHKNLMRKAPGTDLLLAGGPRRRPAKCRRFTQRLEAYGQRDEWHGEACFDGSWKLVPRAPSLLGTTR